MAHDPHHPSHSPRSLLSHLPCFSRLSSSSSQPLLYNELTAPVLVPPIAWRPILEFQASQPTLSPQPSEKFCGQATPLGSYLVAHGSQYLTNFTKIFTAIPVKVGAKSCVILRKSPGCVDVGFESKSQMHDHPTLNSCCSLNLRDDRTL
eukprot:g28317.t1